MHCLLEEDEWKGLDCYFRKSPTLRDATGMVPSVGGFLGRKCDGEPGPKSIWRGLGKLAEITAVTHIFFVWLAVFSPDLMGHDELPPDPRGLRSMARMPRTKTNGDHTWTSLKDRGDKPPDLPFSWLLTIGLSCLWVHERLSILNRTSSCWRSRSSGSNFRRDTSTTPSTSSRAPAKSPC